MVFPYTLLACCVSIFILKDGKACRLLVASIEEKLWWR